MRVSGAPRQDFCGRCVAYRDLLTQRGPPALSQPGGPLLFVIWPVQHPCRDRRVE